MERIQILQGVITAQPRTGDGFTEFYLQTGPRTHRVIRMDPQWQKKDIVFLCIGQTVTLWGTEDGGAILAEKIRITDCSERNYLGEDNHGNHSVPDPDPGDPAL